MATDVPYWDDDKQDELRKLHDPKAQIAAALGWESAQYMAEGYWSPDPKGDPGWLIRDEEAVVACTALEQLAKRGWRLRINDIRSSNGRGTLKGYVVRLEGRDRHGYHTFGKGEDPDLPTAILAACAAALKGDADA